MKSSQDGFTLIEVVIALVLMAIILTTLGGLSFTVARQAVIADNTAATQAASLDMVNRLAALPYTQLQLQAGTTECDSTGSVNNWYRRCATVAPSGNGMRVDVVTTPEQRGIASVTVTLIRNPPPADNPLCTFGC
jgi:prepilin-type N-terminal cleavage/methylation domain-containing protein